MRSSDIPLQENLEIHEFPLPTPGWLVQMSQGRIVRLYLHLHHSA
jgi:hypothetical protein